MIRLLTAPLDPERREAVKILVATRWVLLAALVFNVNFRHGTSTWDWIGLNLLLVVAIGLNALMQRAFVSGRGMAKSLPFFSSVYDLTGLTVAIALVDGIENPTFIFYYPAAMALSFVFPGRISIAVAGATMAGYLLAVTLAHDNFDSGAAVHQKALVIRPATMAGVVLAANLVISIERRRRERAVAAEATRQSELRELERRGADERRRLRNEVHDGISQGAYMVSLGLESLADQLHSELEPESPAHARVAALERAAKGTLLEARGLLVDLRSEGAADAGLSLLARSQAEEFEAVTGIPVSVEVSGQETALRADVIAQLQRVFQEALANVFKHAQAESVQIRVAYSPEAVEIGIADDGIGFDPSAIRATGNGLRVMAERAASLKGSLRVDSETGRGTTLTMSIPASAAVSPEPASSGLTVRSDEDDPGP